MPLPPLPESAIVLRQRVDNWLDAVRLAGGALAASGATDPAYTQRMVDVIDEFGAYLVIAPGLALAHARPGPDVLSDGLSVVTLETPVRFGHPYNDPVSVVVGLAVATPDDHVTSVAALANVFNDHTAIAALSAARTTAEVKQIMASEWSSTL